MIPGPLELTLRGCAWAADYAYVARWHLLSLRPRHPRWLRRGSCAGEPTVVLIPGIFETWRLMEPLARVLVDAGHPVHVVGLGLGSRPVGALADQVRRALVQDGVDDAVVVAHSKGGLIGKHLMLSTTRVADGSLTVRGMVAVNTPFGGSRYAGWIPLSSVQDLRPSALRALSDQRGVDERITSVYARWDPHVPEGSELSGATNVRLRHRGHFRVLGLRDAQQAVVAAVGEVTARSPAAPEPTATG